MYMYIHNHTTRAESVKETRLRNAGASIRASRCLEKGRIPIVDRGSELLGRVARVVDLVVILVVILIVDCGPELLILTLVE